MICQSVWSINNSVTIQHQMFAMPSRDFTGIILFGKRNNKSTQNYLYSLGKHCFTQIKKKIKEVNQWISLFKQVGAPSHFSLNVSNELNDKFGNH